MPGSSSKRPALARVTPAIARLEMRRRYTLIGAMLIYGAFDPASRTVILLVAVASKVVFIALVLSQGGRYLRRQVGTAALVDVAMVGLFVWYLVAIRAG